MKTVLSITLLAILLSPAQALEISVVSKPYTNSAIATGDSLSVELSATGEWAAITSSADALVPNLPRGRQSLQVYLRNTRTGETLLVSKSPAGDRAHGDSIATGISADGRFVVFESDAPDLVPGDDNDASDIFLYDRETHTNTLLSRTATELADADSTGATITPDGRFVLFESEASNLAEGDDNGARDLFLFDRLNGEIQLITRSLNDTGTAEPNMIDFSPSMSDDGRRIVYLTTATNAAVGFDLRTNAQVMLYDTQLGTTEWISRNTNGEPQSFTGPPVISGDGSTVAFYAWDYGQIGYSSNRITGEVTYVFGNAQSYLKMYDTSSGNLTDVLLPDGTRRGAELTDLALNYDGKALVYTVHFEIPSVPPTSTQVQRHLSLHIYDRAAQANRLILSTAPGESETRYLGDIRISDNGNIATFVTDILWTNRSQLYAYSLTTSNLVLLSKNPLGAPADQGIDFPTLSRDGSTAAFASTAETLADSDDKLSSDLFFLNTSGAERPRLLSAAHSSYSSSTANGSSRILEDVYGHQRMLSSYLSFDGRVVTYLSDAPNLTADNTNGALNIFAHDLLADRSGSPSVGLGDGAKYEQGASADGTRLVVMQSADPKLGTWSFYTYNPITRATDTLNRIIGTNVAPAGGLTLDGRLFFFYSRSNNLVHVLDLAQDTVFDTGVSISQFKAISGGGRYLFARDHLYDWKNQTTNTPPGFAFASSMDDEVFLLSANSVSRSVLSVYFPASGISHQFAARATYAQISPDGSTVVFGQDDQTIVYDVPSGTITPLRSTSGEDFILSGTPNMSPDARFIVFPAKLSRSQYSDIYLYDRILEKLTLINRAPNALSSDLPAGTPYVSADGRTVVFDSMSSDLVTNDRNQSSDVFVARLEIQDDDHDGLEDGWEIKYYGNLSGDPGADLDGDGLTTAQEYTLGTNPKESSSRLPQLQFQNASTGAFVRFNTAPWKSYQLEYCYSLNSSAWTALGSSITAVGNSLEFPVPASATKGFFRVRLVQ